MQITIEQMLIMYSIGFVAHINDGEVWCICEEKTL
jgi:hypothetical protein